VTSFPAPGRGVHAAGCASGRRRACPGGPSPVAPPPASSTRSGRAAGRDRPPPGGSDRSFAVSCAFRPDRAGKENGGSKGGEARCGVRRVFPASAGPPVKRAGFLPDPKTGGLPPDGRGRVGETGLHLLNLLLQVVTGP